MDFADTIKPKLCAGADKTRNAADSYKVVPGQQAGVLKLAKAWHAVGHRVIYYYYRPIRDDADSPLRRIAAKIPS